MGAPHSTRVPGTSQISSSSLAATGRAQPWQSSEQWWQKSHYLCAGTWEVSHHRRVMLPLLVMSQPAELPQKQGVVPFVLKDKGCKLDVFQLLVLWQ